MKYIYDKLGERIATHHVGTEEELREQYKEEEKIYISDLDLGEKVIIANGEIRAYTRLDYINEGMEQLQSGEYIKNNEIITIEKPGDFHIWDNKKNKWIYDKNLEVIFINSEILNKETNLNDLYDTLDKATARHLKALIADTQWKIDKIIKELETLENKLKELEG